VPSYHHLYEIMITWCSCTCAPKLGDDFAVSGAEVLDGSAGKEASTSALEVCSTRGPTLDEGLTPSTRTAGGSIDECSTGMAVSGTMPRNEGEMSSLVDGDVPTSSERAAEEGEKVKGAPDIRSLLSSSELAAVQALERELGVANIQELHKVLVAGEALESCLLRYLKIQNFRVNQAAKALKAHLAWRASMKPADLADLRPSDICGCADEFLEKYMPTWHQGYDLQGRPVVFTHYGKFRFGPVLEAGVTVEKILRLQVRTSERIARLCGKQSSKLGCDISNALVIMDAEGWDSNNLWCKASFDWIRGLTKLDTEHYPERMGQMVILNAPSSLYYFWKSISWILPEKTRKQVQIFSGREMWEPELLCLIDASELPFEYGGSKPTSAVAAPPRL